MSETRALAACADYEHWASEIRRLTAAIGECSCPHEAENRMDNTSAMESCFRRASTEEFPGSQPEDGKTRRNLDAIVIAVAGCEACSRLCWLIRDRKIARQRFGVAKRKVRQIGRALRERRTGEGNEAADVIEAAGEPEPLL